LSISLRSVNKSFGGLQAVKDLTFNLKPGFVTGLVGPNGAGKTTIFNLVSGFLRPDSGTVEFKGTCLNSLPPQRIVKKGIARSFQDLRLFEQMTVLDNIMVAFQNQPGENLSQVFFRPWSVGRVETENLKLAESYLEKVGLLGKKDTTVGDLSYGEQKLLVIVRLLATNAECVLLDEPMSGVDEKTRDVIIDLVRNVASQGRTVCLIEHNIDIVTKACDWLLFLDQGTLLSEGTPKQIISDSHLTEIYFGH